VNVFIRLVLALVFGGVIGLERGRQGRAAGMRTHILVCIGATLASMTGIYVYNVLGVSNDPLRLAAQVISGIGFLGVGTILIKGRFQITGLTTAAGIWCAATIGIALGIGFYEGAIVTFIASVSAVTIMHRLEYSITGRHTRFGMYVEIDSVSKIRTTIDHLTEHYRSTDIQVTPPRSGSVGNVGIGYVIECVNEVGDRLYLHGKLLGRYLLVDLLFKLVDCLVECLFICRGNFFLCGSDSL
jgi:putative Mg2+ transporter-C (MgtC) family protein